MGTRDDEDVWASYSQQERLTRADPRKDVLKREIEAQKGKQLEDREAQELKELKTKVNLKELKMQVGGKQEDAATHAKQEEEAKKPKPFHTETIKEKEEGEVESAQTKPACTRGRPAAKKKRTDVDTFTIKLTVRGSLDQINRFLELINQVAPLTNVTQTELNLGGKSVLAKLGIKTDFEADIVLETYFFTQPILSTVDSPLPEVSGQEETVITELNNFIYQSAVQPDQVFGGGLQDLFGVEELQFLESIQTGEATTSPRQ